MLCKACGADNDATHHFCSSCGQKLVRVCQGCQFGNALQSSFCSQCGKPLDGGYPPVGNVDSGRARHGVFAPANSGRFTPMSKINAVMDQLNTFSCSYTANCCQGFEPSTPTSIAPNMGRRCHQQPAHSAHSANTNAKACAGTKLASSPRPRNRFVSTSSIAAGLRRPTPTPTASMRARW